jgi:hypothetical protein
MVWVRKEYDKDEGICREYGTSNVKEIGIIRAMLRVFFYGKDNGMNERMVSLREQ